MPYVSESKWAAEIAERDALLHDLRHWISQAHYNAIGAQALLARLNTILNKKDAPHA